MTLTSVGIYLFCAFVAGTVGAFMGMSKDRAGLGFFLGVVGWIITAVMESSLNERRRRNEDLARTMQATNLQRRPTAERAALRAGRVLAA